MEVSNDKTGKILVVENSPQTLHVIRKILSEVGYEVKSAANGREGLEIARSEEVELIVSAVTMPEMDGFEFCKNVREGSLTDTIPFIFLSAKASLDDKQSAFRDGADDYITKPFEPPDLLMRVDAALKRAARYRYEAYTDSLTDLNNRRYFDKKLVEMIAHAKRYQEVFCLAMLDVDHFKKFNDKHGHVAGDEALKHLARLIINNIRQSDIHARFGGEEFTVLLPSTDKANSITFMERLREALSQTHMTYDGKELSFTISIGIAQYPDDADSTEALIKCSDEALYESKSKGRNLTTVYHP